MKATLYYVIITAMRDKLFIGLFAGMIFAAIISSSLSGTTLIEAQSMALSFTSTSLRLVIILGLIIFVAFHIRYAFSSKEIDVMLSRPLSRASLVFSWWLGFAIIALTVIAFAVTIVFIIAPLNMQGFMIWGVSLLLEAFIIIAMTIFTSLILKSAALSAITSTGFYVISRMIGFFIATSQSRLLFKNNILNEISRNAIEWIAIFIPRLDFFSKSEWLIYGIKDYSELQLMLIQAIIFIPLIIFATIVDFRRKQF